MSTSFLKVQNFPFYYESEYRGIFFLQQNFKRIENQFLKMNRSIFFTHTLHIIIQTEVELTCTDAGAESRSCFAKIADANGLNFKFCVPVNGIVCCSSLISLLINQKTFTVTQPLVDILRPGL